MRGFGVAQSNVAIHTYLVRKHSLNSHKTHNIDGFPNTSPSGEITKTAQQGTLKLHSTQQQ